MLDLGVQLCRFSESPDKSQSLALLSTRHRLLPNRREVRITDRVSFPITSSAANGAADDLVDAVGRIVLVNDFAFAGIRPGANLLNRWVGRLNLNTHWVPGAYCSRDNSRQNLQE